MKKFLNFALGIMLCTLLASAAFLTPALAEDTARFKVDSAENLSAGDTFSVGLNISGSYNIHVINLAVTFDPNALELTDVEYGDVLNTARQNSGFCVLEYKDIAKDGFVKLGLAMPTDALTAEGQLFKMTFKVADGVTVNQQIFVNIYELSYMPLGATEGTPIQFETENAVIKVTGASDPEGGFVSGTSGTPNPEITQVPTLGSSTEQPGSNDAPGSDDAPGSEDNEGSETSTPTNPMATRLPGETANDDQNGPGAVIYIVIAAAVIAAVAAVVVVIRKKKSGSDE